MKMKIQTVVAPLLIVAAAAIGLYLQLGSENSPEDSSSGDSVVAKIHKNKPRKPESQFRARTGKRASAAQRVREEREKPAILNLAPDEEDLLTEYSKAMLMELQKALDSENFFKVRELVAKMLEIPPDPMFGADGVAAILRRKAVDALGWFGAEGLPMLAAMLGDADPDIAQATFDQFQLALEDISLSDYDRADIIYMASKVLTNVDDLEMLFMEINNMRHSVGAGLLVSICQEGTDAAKGLMPDAIEFFTGEDNLQTVEDVQDWLDENPDGPDDDDLYGGDTSSDDDE